MHMHNLPAILTLDQDAAFIVGAVGELAIFIRSGEHEGVADHGRIAIKLQAWLEEIVAEVAGCPGPGVLDHEEMKVEAILAVGGDEPFVEG